MKKILSLLFPLAILTSGCEHEELPNKQVDSQDGRIFTASFEQNETRTYVENGNLLRWNAGDQISLFDGNTLNRQYQFDGENGDNSGTFSIVSNPFGTGNDLDCHYAVYPYASSVKITEGGVITATLPAVQSYAENSFGIGANTMVAVTKDVDDTFLKFKNVGGYLKLQLYGEDVTVKSIILNGSNNEKLAGKASITPLYGDEPTVTMSDEATQSITLNCGEGVKIGSTEDMATGFWIVVPPTTFDTGFTITITDINDKAFTKSTSNKIDIVRNVIKPMAAFEVEIQDENIPYLTFTADAEQTLTMSKDVATLEYSVNGEEWAELETNTITFGDTYGTLRLRGMSEIGTAIEINPETAPKITFGNNTKVRCEGDIRTLVNYKNYEHADCSKARFIALFGYCTQLTSAPSLPSEILAEACYMHMFWGCSSLTDAPILPATTLSGGCYAYMFGCCSSLIEAPELPSTALTEGCYMRMFYECSSLTKAPDLLATTDGGNSYLDMFKGCRSLNYLRVMLISAPSNGRVDILQSMGSTGTVVVNRAATWINQYNIPSGWDIIYEGESSWTGDNTPYITFSSDEKQTLELDIDVSPFENTRDHYTTIEYSVDGSIWQDLYNRVVTFGGVTGDLKLRSKSPYGTAKAEVRTDGSSPDYHFIFGCGYDNIMTYFLSTITIKFGTESKVFCTGDIRTLIDYESPETADSNNARFTYLFNDATVLSSSPELPINVPASFCYEGMFDGCASLITAPKLPAKTLAMQCYSSMFRNCTSLINASELPATTLVDGCYLNMFYGCTSLITAPELPATTLARSCYAYMFQNCSNLKSAPKLDATTLAPHCYASMFSSCKSLVTAPDLPALSLIEDCYSQMFINCSKLSYVKMMAIDISDYNCLSSWLPNSSTGTFIKNAHATWDESKVIPKGWTVMTN